jgi:hypothetical protein
MMRMVSVTKKSENDHMTNQSIKSAPNG